MWFPHFFSFWPWNSYYEVQQIRRKEWWKIKSDSSSFKSFHGRHHHSRPVKHRCLWLTTKVLWPFHMGENEGQAKEKSKSIVSQRIRLGYPFKIGGDTIPTVREKPVKNLGRLYSIPLTDRHWGTEVQKVVLKGLKSIDKTCLPGKIKAWCYQHGLLPHILWPLKMYEITLSCVKRIQQFSNKYQGKWLKVPPCISKVGLFTLSVNL